MIRNIQVTLTLAVGVIFLAILCVLLVLIFLICYNKK